jgi:L-ascorbate metabolism protein UlaG (beta-lactamase superfamily)
MTTSTPRASKNCASSRRKSPVIVSGLGNAKLLRKQGYQNALELDWGEHTQGRARPPCTLWSASTARARRVRPNEDPVGLVCGGDSPRGAIYFAGDTGYSPHFKAQGEQYGPFALSLLPIGAYEPRWFMKDIHLKPRRGGARRTWTSTASKASAFTLGYFSSPGRRSTPPSSTLRPR